MAIKYSELKDKLLNDPLNTIELNTIRATEEWIDEEIKKNFGTSGYEVWIDKSIVSFNYNPVLKMVIHAKEPRRHVMRTELESRYNSAGWKIEWPDDMDNPNVKFKGK